LHNPIPRNGYLMILHIAYLRPSAKEENSKVVRPRFLISPRISHSPKILFRSPTAFFDFSTHFTFAKDPLSIAYRVFDFSTHFTFAKDFLSYLLPSSSDRLPRFLISSRTSHSPKISCLIFCHPLPIAYRVF